MSDIFDLKIDSKIIRSQIQPVSKKEILQRAIHQIETIFQATLIGYRESKIEIAMNDLVCECVGESLVSMDELDKLRKKTKEKEEWLERWSEYLEKLKNSVNKEYPSPALFTPKPPEERIRANPHDQDLATRNKILGKK